MGKKCLIYHGLGKAYIYDNTRNDQKDSKIQRQDLKTKIFCIRSKKQQPMSKRQATGKGKIATNHICDVFISTFIC